MDKRIKPKIIRSKWKNPINYHIEDAKNSKTVVSIFNFCLSLIKKRIFYIMFVDLHHTGAVVKMAIRIWEQETCLRFRERVFFFPPGIVFKGNKKGLCICIYSIVFVTIQTKLNIP